MGLIKATRKDSVHVALCSKCQLEVEEQDVVCSNCGQTLRFSTEEMSLEPIETDSDPIPATYRPSQNSQRPSHTGVAKSLSHKLGFGRTKNPPANNPAIFSMTKMLLILALVFSIAVIIIFNSFPDSAMNLLSQPFLNSAIDKNKNFQNALLFYRQKNQQWPQTVENMHYENLFNQEQDFYFVLTTKGDYYQVFTAPFFIKGKSINWHFDQGSFADSSTKLNSKTSAAHWSCSSQDFVSIDLSCSAHSINQ